MMLEANHRTGIVRSLILFAAAALVLSSWGLTTPSGADDRDLLTIDGAPPYVFVLFDTTYSMTLDLEDDAAPLLDDDPHSKLLQAKEALDVVLQDETGASFGFATFPNFARLRVHEKACGLGCVGPLFSGRNDEDLGVDSQWCDGIEGNNDDSFDHYQNYNLRWVTEINERGLEVGDLVPLDWGSDNIDLIRQRLAPNLVLGEETPDYGIARYFNDAPLGGKDFLELKNEAARPFFAWGNTPLGGALQTFKTWYQDWEPLAEENDPDFAAGCRDVVVVLLTDGFETCGGAPEAAAQDLFDNLGIPVYVIGFAVNNPALDAIALAGGTDSDPDDPTIAHYRAEDQQALIQALTFILEEAKSRSRSFAGAAVSSLQAEGAKQIVLTSFSPITDNPIWPGRVDAFLKPVPFITGADGRPVPDRSAAARCGAGETSGCLAWAADEVLLTQAPDPIEVATGTLRLGNATDERRVYYGRADGVGGVPAERKLFAPTEDPDERLDLYGEPGMEIDPAAPDFADQGRQVIEHTLVEKQGEILNRVTNLSESIDYVLGDVFHSDPKIVGPPERVRYFSADVEGRAVPCGPRLDGEADVRPPYPCFAQAQQFRRRVLLVGANDGQLHAFDVSRPVKSTSAEGDVTVELEVGTGHEVFSFVPREAMPTLARLSRGGSHEFSVDGTVTVDDVVIDPQHDGTPVETKRQWRTVAVGGMREGGRSYYALDITQPDKLDDDGVPTSPSYVPSCIDGAAACATEAPFAGLGPYPALPYPMVLWEIMDEWDEDADGAPDLGFTWSIPNTGRIKVLDEEGEIAEKYVAVFGGGMDPEFKRDPVDENGAQNPRSGNYLYMVDIETGKTIYKRRLDRIGGLVGPGMVPSEPAAVDTDFDSYLDTIYIGTTAGYMFKADISTPQEIVETTVDDWSSEDPDTGSPPLERDVRRIISNDWEPFPLFSTGGRPIYYPPSVVFVSALNSYALAFGTGDREDLWSEDDEEQRFYTFLDGGFTPDTPNLPFDETKLAPVALGAEPADLNFLTDVEFDPGQTSDTNPGWALALGSSERLVGKPLALSGLLVFGTYTREPFDPDDAADCRRTGESHLFAVTVGSAAGLYFDAEGDSTRFRVVDDFVTTPFVDAGGADELPDDTTLPPDPGENPCAGMEELVQAMRARLFPRECDFASYSLDIMTIRSDTGMECLVPLPVCIIGENWKEF